MSTRRRTWQTSGLVLVVAVCLSEAFEDHGFEMEDDNGEQNFDHESDAAQHVSTALSLTLFGTVAWVMFLFYFVNSSDEDIVKETWKSLTAMISIFVAVLFFNASRDITIDFLGEVSGEGPVNMRSRLISIVRLALFLALLKWLMFLLRYDQHEWKPMHVVGNLGSHVIGFSFIEVFGSGLMPSFSGHVGLACLGVLVAVLALGFCHFLAYLWRRTVADPQKEKEEETWREVCLEQECESASLALGLLVSMVTRFAISGTMPPIHGSPWRHATKQVWMLFGSAIFYGLLLLVASFFGEGARALLTEHEGKLWGAVLYKATELFEQVMSMSMGWCLLCWGQWLFWNLTDDKGVGSGSHMTARLILAMAFSLLAFIGIFLIDCFADAAANRSQKNTRHDGVKADSWWSLARSMRKQIMMLGLLMGLAWEDAFTAGSEVIAHHFEGHLRLAVDAGISLFICVVVLPAWVLYIFPKSLEEPVLCCESSSFTAEPEQKLLGSQPSKTVEDTPRS